MFGVPVLPASVIIWNCSDDVLFFVFHFSYFDVVVIFRLSFMTGSSLPPFLVDSNQRQSSGIIFYTS
jgi:hypothetical protein